MSRKSGYPGQANNVASFHTDGFKGVAGATKWRRASDMAGQWLFICPEQVSSSPLALHLNARPTGFLMHFPHLQEQSCSYPDSPSLEDCSSSKTQAVPLGVSTDPTPSQEDQNCALFL